MPRVERFLERFRVHIALVHILRCGLMLSVTMPSTKAPPVVVYSSKHPRQDINYTLLQEINLSSSSSECECDPREDVRPCIGDELGRRACHANALRCFRVCTTSGATARSASRTARDATSEECESARSSAGVYTPGTVHGRCQRSRLGPSVADTYVWGRGRGRVSSMRASWMRWSWASVYGRGRRALARRMRQGRGMGSQRT